MAGYKTRWGINTFLGLALLLITALCAAFSLSNNDDFDLARQEILLRKIGHDVLLHAGDSTSRVMPVKKVAKDEYQIRFENEFTFQPDSLVKIISRSLAKDKLANNNYIVNVLNCTGNDVIFGYVIAGNEKDNVVPCAGRKQPKNCYIISIKFQDKGITITPKGYLLGGLPLLAFVGLLISRSVKNKKEQAAEPGRQDTLITIGNTLFDIEKRTLHFAATVTELTAKENKILLILAQPANTIVERSSLQKQIWEDEGVIVGRSLDMFISKLRKKLENDASVQLINIHGKGYKLKIDE